MTAEKVTLRERVQAINERFQDYKLELVLETVGSPTQRLTRRDGRGEHVLCVGMGNRIAVFLDGYEAGMTCLRDAINA